MLGNQYTFHWDQLIPLLYDPNRDQLNIFLLRYVFQKMLDQIWRKKNGRRHGEQLLPPNRITKFIVKNVHNRFSSFELWETTCTIKACICGLTHNELHKRHDHRQLLKKVIKAKCGSLFYFYISDLQVTFIVKQFWYK